MLLIVACLLALTCLRLDASGPQSTEDCGPNGSCPSNTAVLADQESLVQVRVLANRTGTEKDVLQIPYAIDTSLPYAIDTSLPYAIQTSLTGIGGPIQTSLAGIRGLYFGPFFDQRLFLSLAIFIGVIICSLLWWYRAKVVEQGEASVSVIVSLANMWPTIFLHAFSVGMLAPLESYISLNFFAQSYTTLGPSQIHCHTNPDESYCKSAVNDNVKWIGIASAISLILHICLGPALGVISDSYGRKPVVVVCGVLGVFPTVAQGLFVYFDVTLYVFYGLLIFKFIPVVAVWFALISDLVGSAERRATAFGLVLVGYELSILVGMVTGAQLSLQTAVGVAILMHAGNIIYLFFGLRESLPLERRAPMKLEKLLPTSAFSILMRNPRLRQLCTIFMIAEFVGAGLEKVGISYFQKYLNWGKDDNYMNAILGQLSVLVWVGGMLQPIIAMVGEVGLVFVAQLFGAVFDIGLCFVTKPSEIFVLQAALSGALALTFPAMAALKGSMVADDEQGHLQGAVQTVRSIAACLGPVGFGILFNALDTNPGLISGLESKVQARLIFLAGTIFYVIAILVTSALPRDMIRQPCA